MPTQTFGVLRLLGLVVWVAGALGVGGMTPTHDSLFIKQVAAAQPVTNGLLGMALNQVFTPTAGVTWTWPLNGGPLMLTKHETVVENTDYEGRNLDLIHPRPDYHISCFGVGLHRAYHAGFDLYLPDGTTEGATVRAVSNGQVVYIRDNVPEDNAIVIYHPSVSVYSVYRHVTAITVFLSQTVSTGQPIAEVVHLDYTGRFPEIHPFEDDSHLHFELRLFGDGSAIFPAGAWCNNPPNPTISPVGVGYTYPGVPNYYSYLPPVSLIGLINARPERMYLPMVNTQPLLCQEGQDLMAGRNGSFEGSITDPKPWVAVMTDLDDEPPPPTPLYHLVQNNTALAYAGNQFALLGSRSDQSYIADEELVISLRIPQNTTSLEWRQQAHVSGFLKGVDPGDNFMLSIQDAWGLVLFPEVVIDETYEPVATYAPLTVVQDIPPFLQGKRLNFSYSSLSDGDGIFSFMRVDAVQVITHCGS